MGNKECFLQYCHVPVPFKEMPKVSQAKSLSDLLTHNLEELWNNSYQKLLPKTIRMVQNHSEPTFIIWGSIFHLQEKNKTTSRKWEEVVLTWSPSDRILKRKVFLDTYHIWRPQQQYFGDLYCMPCYANCTMQIFSTCLLVMPYGNKNVSCPLLYIFFLLSNCSAYS